LRNFGGGWLITQSEHNLISKFFRRCGHEINGLDPITEIGNQKRQISPSSLFYTWLNLKSQLSYEVLTHESTSE